MENIDSPHTAPEPPSETHPDDSFPGDTELSQEAIDMLKKLPESVVPICKIFFHMGREYQVSRMLSQLKILLPKSTIEAK